MVDLASKIKNSEVDNTGTNQNSGLPSGNLLHSYGIYGPLSSMIYSTVLNAQEFSMAMYQVARGQVELPRIGMSKRRSQGFQLQTRQVPNFKKYLPTRTDAADTYVYGDGSKPIITYYYHIWGFSHIHSPAILRYCLGTRVPSHHSCSCPWRT